jgi:hypothetical protein
VEVLGTGEYYTVVGDGLNNEDEMANDKVLLSRNSSNNKLGYNVIWLSILICERIGEK